MNIFVTTLIKTISSPDLLSQSASLGRQLTIYHHCVFACQLFFFFLNSQLSIEKSTLFLSLPLPLWNAKYRRIVGGPDGVVFLQTVLSVRINGIQSDDDS